MNEQNNNQGINSMMNNNIPNSNGMGGQPQNPMPAANNVAQPTAMSFSVPPQPMPAVNNVEPVNPVNFNVPSASEVNNQPPMASNPVPPVNNNVGMNPNVGVNPMSEPQNNMSNVSLGTVNNDGNQNLAFGNNNQLMNGIPTTNELPSEPVSSELPDDEDKPKKKASPIVIIALILVLLVGAAAGYYFLLNTPKKIFGSAYDKLTKASDDAGVLDGYVNYALKINVNTGNEQLKAYTDIINNISVSGTSGYVDSNKTFNTKNVISYKDKQLVDFHALVDINSNTSYVKLDNIFDKVLMVKNETDSSSITSVVDTNVNDYLTLKSALVSDIKKTLETADYKKELVVLNGSRVTKSVLLINKKLVDALYDNLLQDTNFLAAYAKISQTTVDEVKADLTKEKADSTSIDGSITMYTSLIKNELLKVEVAVDDDSLAVTKSNDSYNYEYKEAGTTTFNGVVKVTESGDNTNLVFNVNIVGEDINFGFNCTYSKASGVDNLDVSNAVNIDDLTDEEMATITTKLMESDAFKTLLKDLGLDEESLADLSSAI